MQSKPTTSKRRPRFLRAGSKALDSDPLTLGEGLLTAPEVARILHVSRSLVYQLVSGGDLPSLKVGSARRFRRQEVQRYLAKHSGPIRRWKKQSPPQSTIRNSTPKGSP